MAAAAAAKGLSKAYSIGRAGLNSLSSINKSGWTRKKTVIKTRKDGTQVIKETGYTLTPAGVAVGVAAAGFALTGAIASWGAYKSLNNGRSPLDDLTDWAHKKKAKQGGLFDSNPWAKLFLNPGGILGFFIDW